MSWLWAQMVNPVGKSCGKGRLLGEMKLFLCSQRKIFPWCDTYFVLVCRSVWHNNILIIMVGKSVSDIKTGCEATSLLISYKSAAAASPSCQNDLVFINNYLLLNIYCAVFYLFFTQAQKQIQSHRCWTKIQPYSMSGKLEFVFFIYCCKYCILSLSHPSPQ